MLGSKIIAFDEKADYVYVASDAHSVVQQGQNKPCCPSVCLPPAGYFCDFRPRERNESGIPQNMVAAYGKRSGGKRL